MEPSRDPHDDDRVQGEYLAPDPKDEASGRNWRAAGGTAVGLGLVAAKFKGLLLALVNFKFLLFGGKYIWTAVTFAVSVWAYTLFFGFKFALVFVLLILVHEVGHAIFVRGFGLAAPNITFVPLLGAFTSWHGTVRSSFERSVIAYGGPLLGTLAAGVCFVYGYTTNEPFWLACAYTAFFLNLFNMIPLGIFDGARIVAPIPRPLWIAGLATVIVAAIAFHWFSPLLLLLLVFSIPHTIELWRSASLPSDVTAGQRATIAFAYFGLLAVQLAGVVASRVAIPSHAPLS